MGRADREIKFGVHRRAKRESLVGALEESMSVPKSGGLSRLKTCAHASDEGQSSSLGACRSLCIKNMGETFNDRNGKERFMNITAKEYRLALLLRQRMCSSELL